MAMIKAPRRYPQDVCKRRPRGFEPRGTSRGGPERPANDPRRNPQGRLCGGPARSAKEPQLPNETAQEKVNGKKVRGRKEERKKSKGPTIVTVEKNGKERNWGHLSRTNSWRVGCFLEDLDGEARVFIEKDAKRRDVQVEKHIERGKARIWLKEKKPQPPQDPETRQEEDQSQTVEEVTGVDEVPPEEIQMERMMWLVERVTSLEKEKEEMKQKLLEMEAKMANQENTAKELVERFGVMGAAITRIAGHVEQQNIFNQSTKASLWQLVEEVTKHQGHLQEVVRVLQNHEQHIAKNGMASQEMAQYINALIEENAKGRLWLTGLMQESQAQTEVLRQHQLGQQVLAGVIKQMMGQWQPQQHSQPQSVARPGPIVTEVDDDDNWTVQGFPQGPDPHRPPDSGMPVMEMNLPWSQNNGEASQQF